MFPLGLVILILGLGGCLYVFFVTDLFFDPLPVRFLQALTTFLDMLVAFIVVIHITSVFAPKLFCFYAVVLYDRVAEYFPPCGVIVLIGVLAVLSKFESAHSLHYSYYHYIRYNNTIHSCIVVAFFSKYNSQREYLQIELPVYHTRTAPHVFLYGVSP